MKAIFLLLLTASLASSVDAHQRSPQAEPSAPRVPIYLSLMGEPFRGVPGGPQPLADWFAVADRNHDGSVSLAEMLDDASRFFKTIDTDGDDVITPSEMARYETDIAPGRVRFEGGLRPFRSSDTSDNVGSRASYNDDDSEKRSRGRFGRGSRDLQYLEVPQPIMMADSDFNQRVTADEFAKLATKRFNANDKNKDGLLQPGELTAPLDRKGRPTGPGQVW